MWDPEEDHPTSAEALKEAGRTPLAAVGGTELAREPDC